VGKITRYLIEPWVAAYEQARPVPQEITWLDAQALERKSAQNARLAQMPEDAALLEIVQDVAEKMQTYPAKVIIYQGKKPNAVHLNNNTLLIEERKITETPREELAATIAHELAHQQRNLGTLIVAATRSTAEIGIGVATAIGFMQHKPAGMNNEAAFATAAALGVGVTMATHTALSPVEAARRRNEECVADAISAKVNGATPMKRVLEAKLDEPQKEKNAWQRLNATHPSHAERIAALEKIEAVQEKSY
jgi:Zn-dependent protease with chaperone function